jgi:hypothetical protein
VPGSSARCGRLIDCLSRAPDAQDLFCGEGFCPLVLRNKNETGVLFAQPKYFLVSLCLSRKEEPIMPSEAPSVDRICKRLTPRKV